MSEEKKQKLKEYQKNYHEAKKKKKNKKPYISEKIASLKALFIKTKSLLILTQYIFKE